MFIVCEEIKDGERHLPMTLPKVIELPIISQEELRNGYNRGAI